MLGISVISGFTAIGLQFTIFPMIGYSASLITIKVIAAIIALALLPIVGITFFAPLRNVGHSLAENSSASSHKAIRKSLALVRIEATDIKDCISAYRPLLTTTIISVVIGVLAHVLLGFIVYKPAYLFLSLLALFTLGFLWVVAACVLCEDAALHKGNIDWERAFHLKRFNNALLRLSSKATACLVTFALAFSMIGGSLQAFAEETSVSDDEKSAIDPSEVADVYEPVETKEDVLNPQDQSPVDNAPNDPAPSDDQSKDIDAKPPQDLYPEQPTEGTPVYMEGEATVLQTSEKTFTTVIGGVDVAYEDERGNLHKVDNTLDANRNSIFTDDVTYTNRANFYEAALPDKMDDSQGFTISAKGYTIEFIPQEGDFQYSMAEDNAIRFTEVAEGIDYQYTLVGSVIKEDIILNRAVDPRDFKTKLKLGSGLSIREDDEGLIGIYSQDGLVLDIAAPIAMDAAGAASDNLDLKLIWEDNEPYLVLSPDWNWVSSPDRAYPVRIDPTIDIAPSAVRVGCVEQNHPKSFIGENGYAYAGYDDGVKTGTGDFNHGLGHAICRVYTEINYDFSYIMSEARIDSATFSLFQHTAYSGGASNFGLYRVCQPWDFDDINWRNQESLTHELVQFQYSHPNKSYIDWDVRECVNNWIQGIYPQYGFCVKAENERWMQCELFANRNSANPPRLAINWSIPDPVDESISLDATSINLRTLTEHDADNKLQFDGVFADGIARPRSTVAYMLTPSDEAGLAYASRSYKYPDSTSWQDSIPNATRYKDKLSNWQSHVFYQLANDTIYTIKATAVLDGQSGREVNSDSFLIYKASAKDTLPYIASHYGTTLDALAADNKVQDTLVVDGNTIFVRNPKTADAYNPGELSEDQKKRIDSALMGRGKHCEYGFEPVNMNTGNFIAEITDASIADIEGDFTISRTYNSKNDGYMSLLGRNWSFQYDEHISANSKGELIYTLGDGKSFWFEPDGEGGYIAPQGCEYELMRIPYEVIDENKEPNEEGVIEPDIYYRYEVHQNDGSYKQFDCYGMLQTIVSAKGLETKIEYDEFYRLTSITSPAGNTYSFTLDDLGRISAIALPDGNAISYTYDDRSNLIEVKEATGATLRYVYDDNSYMTEWYDGAGRRMIANAYDDEGRVITQTDGIGNISSLAYVEGTTYATDAAGNTTAYSYDDQYRTTSITYPDGFVENRAYDDEGNLISDAKGSYSYDGAGNLISSKDSLGNTASYTYDAQNRLVSEKKVDGESISYAYDDRGNLTSTTSTSGESHIYSYDALCRLVSDTDADGVTTVYGWSGSNMVSATDPLGHTTSYAYDAMGRCVSETDACGNTSRTYYDALGRVIGETDKTGAHTSYSLGGSGLLESMTDPTGATSYFTYDGASNLVTMTDAQGGVWVYAYDALGNEIAQTDPLGATTKKTYDSRGRLSFETDATGAKTSYVYDGLSRKISETNPQGGTTTYKYIGSGESPILVSDPVGNSTIYTYDANGNTTSILTSDGSLQSASYAQGERLSSSTDGAGLTISMEYTDAGRPKILDMSGHTYHFEYDIAGRVVKATDPEGNSQILENDAAGRVISITDALGNTTHLAYDGEGRQVSATDPLGNTSTTQYDGLGNIICETDALGNSTTSTYNALGLISSLTDAAGNTSSASYDAAGNLIKEISASGAARVYAYDAAGRQISMIDSLGRETKYEYDTAGNMTTSILPDGSTESYSYDLAGNLVSMTDAAGLVVSLEYDARGNITGVASDALGSQSYEYDGASRLISATDAEGRIASVLYDLWGNTISESGFDGIATSYTYDALGSMTTQTDAIGATRRITYDSASRITSITESNGAKSSVVNDAVGRIISVTDALGYIEAYSYDAVGNITSQTDADGYTSYAQYDALGRIIEAIDAAGGKTSYSYDILGNVASITDALDNTESFVYDSEGQLLSHTDAAGNTETFEYDIMGNMVLHTDVVGAKTAYRYDAHGNMVEQTDSLGNVTKYEVSLADTVTKMTQPNGAQYSYSYDKAGRMTSVRTPKGYVRDLIYGTLDDPIEERDNTGAVTKYAYDARGSLTSVIDALGNINTVSYDSLGNAISATDGAGATSSYSYDTLGRLVGYTDGSGVTSSYSYDGRGNLVSERRAVSSQSYTYDALSNIVSKTDGRGGTTSFEYDALGRMTSQIDSLGNKQTFEYDVLGNMVSQTNAAGAKISYAYDAAGNLTETVSAKGAKSGYEYDLAGHLKKVEDPDGSKTSYSYDSMGNVTEVIDALGKKTSYSYDEEGNLTQIIGPAGASEKMEYDLKSRLSALTTPDGATARYSYDALNNMVEKSYSQDADASVLYTFDGEGRIILRTDSTGDAGREYDGAGRLVSETDGSGQKLAYTYDAEGNLASVTYPDGTQARYAYDSNGNIITVSAPEGEYSYAYDSENRPVSLTRPNGTSATYSYDELGYTSSIENKGSDGALLSGFSYSYDADGNIESEVSTTTKTDGGTYSVTREFEYTSAGKLAKTSVTGDADYTEAYSYDAVGNRVHLERTGDGAEAIDYVYDDDNRLVRTSSSKDGETAYTYDEAGNLISKVGTGVDTSYSYGVEGRLIAVREGGRLLMAATYDGDGNRATQSSLYHAERQLNADAPGLGSLPAFDLDSKLNEGSVIHAGISAFTYGFFAMATAFGSSICAPVMPWALDAIMSALASSAHGAEGLPAGIPSLVMDSKAILEDEKNAIASAIGLIPRGLSTTEETFDVVSYVNSTLSSAAQVMTSSSSRSGNVNETYGIGRLASTSPSATSFFLNDGRGSVVQTTNTQGATTSWKSYSAFGQIESSSDLGELPSYGYNAEEQHPTTGLTYLRFRYYEASTSTFGVQDTYLGNIFSPLTLNRYLYCLSNPVNYVDPTGHVSVGSLLTGGIVGTITTAIANIKVTILEVIRPHADEIFGKGSRAKIDRDIALAKAARDRVIKFYCGQAERIAASKKSQAGFYANLERFANDYWYVPIASDIAEVGVSSNNGDIPKTIFNLGMLVASITPAKAIKGTSKLSPIIAKLFGMDKAEDAVDIIEKAYKYGKNGGQITAELTRGNTKIVFKHGERHAEKISVDPRKVENIIADDLEQRINSGEKITQGIKSITIEGEGYQYRYYRLSDDTISVGTYFKEKGQV